MKFADIEVGQVVAFDSSEGSRTVMKIQTGSAYNAVILNEELRGETFILGVNCQVELVREWVLS